VLPGHPAGPTQTTDQPTEAQITRWPRALGCPGRRTTLAGCRPRRRWDVGSVSAPRAARAARGGPLLPAGQGRLGLLSVSSARPFGRGASPAEVAAAGGRQAAAVPPTRLPSRRIIGNRAPALLFQPRTRGSAALPVPVGPPGRSNSWCPPAIPAVGPPFGPLDGLFGADGGRPRRSSPPWATGRFTPLPADLAGHWPANLGRQTSLL